MQVLCPPAAFPERRRRPGWPGIRSFERRISPLLAMVAYAFPKVPKVPGTVQAKSSAAIVPLSDLTWRAGELDTGNSSSGARGCSARQRRPSELEEKLGCQSEVVDSLRDAVQQNEEMLETLADSMKSVNDLDQADLGPELVLGPETIAS